MVLNQYEDLVYGLTHPRQKGSTATLPNEFIFDFKFRDLKTFYDEYLVQARWLAFYERHEECPMPRVTKAERHKIYDKESYEREMILNDLKFSTHIMMSKYAEPSNSRRFVATNDSCLAFAQVTVTPENYKWVFVSRSTEVNKMLPADLHTIGTIIEKWINWFACYSPDHFDPYRGVTVLFILNNPHYYK